MNDYLFSKLIKNNKNKENVTKLHNKNNNNTNDINKEPYRNNNLINQNENFDYLGRETINHSNLLGYNLINSQKSLHQQNIDNINKLEFPDCTKSNDLGLIFKHTYFRSIKQC